MGASTGEGPRLCGRRARQSPTLTLCSASAGAGAGAVELSVTRTFQLGLASGAVAGFTVDAVLFPLDTLKTKLQLAGGAGTAAGGLLGGLYRGFGPAVAASAPSAAAFFGTYDYAKRALEARVSDKRQLPLAHMAAAALGDVASSTVRAPFEVVKQRLQAGAHGGSARVAIRSIWQSQGVRGFFAGYGSLVVRELPFDAIQFPLYEFLKGRWKKAAGGRTLRTWENSACGSVAGGVAAAITTPLDVVKTRIMTQAANDPRYLGIVHGLRKIAREEGVRALYSGIAPRVVWISVGGAVFFGAYEATRAALFPTFAEHQLNEDGRVL